MLKCEICGKELQLCDENYSLGVKRYACPDHVGAIAVTETAREFLIKKNYEDSESNLSKLTQYLGDDATTDYSQFPDAALPEDFEASLDDAEFEEYMDR